MGFLSRLLSNKPSAVTPAQAKALQGQGATLIDVREAAEWKAGHAPKAVHLPLSTLPARLGTLPRGSIVLTVCRSGARSSRAAKLLAAEGFDVRNVSGGMAAWSRADLPVVANGGRVGQIV